MKTLQDLKPGRERILRFADMLDGSVHDNSFHWDFGEWFSEMVAGDNCGTVGCAVGYAMHIGMINNHSSSCEAYHKLCEFLGLDPLVAGQKLFNPGFDRLGDFRPMDVKAKHVADGLRYYARVGQVKDYEIIVRANP